jgi:L-threonylcarbamoyladenylate synthase
MSKIDLSRAIAALKCGELVVYPTDTLYALGADVYNEDAVRRIFEIKHRPFDIPLSIAVASFDSIESIAFVNDIARRLAEQFLPGSLTLVLNKKSTISSTVTGGLDKVAVRIPDNEIALELLFKFGPLTATSANVHDMETPQDVKGIKKQFKDGDVAVYLDCGKLNASPSTIVDITTKTPKIIREGIITKKDILDAIRHG